MSWDPAEEITKYEDQIDSREVIARIEYLDDLPKNDADEITGRDSGGTYVDGDLTHELAALKALAEEASGYAADWKDGEQLIRDSYFRDYAQELAEELDMIPKDARWPANCIDWDQAARELQMDYASVSFDGIDYWIR